MKRVFFILVPSLVPTGPVKGAIALANCLVGFRKVSIVTLKRGAGAKADIDERVEVVHLWKIASRTPSKVRAYRQLLRESGMKDELVSVSMCFSADLVNSFCRSRAFLCSSVRGNLPENYHMDYGWKGRLLAYFHLIMLRRFDVVTAMTSEMCSQVSRFIGRAPEIVGNFVDEVALQKYTAEPKSGGAARFVFVGSLTIRKRPELLIQAVKELHHQGHPVKLDLLGSGPLYNKLNEMVSQWGLTDFVRILGQVDEPYPLVRAASAFVLPSMSEGLSRAALEALFLGTPCVLRSVDGNPALIENGVNGILFESDVDLSAAMLEVLNLEFKDGQNLLPQTCSQAPQSVKLLEILERSANG